MTAAKKYRYPGINSFETADTDIFFGREEDRQLLADRVEIEKNLLLYSRSGLGKSSLLKAALIPELATRGFQSFYIRLGLYQEGSLPPVQSTLRRSILTNPTGQPITFLHKFLNRRWSLWQAFKSYQITSADDRPIVLIFDQFEELGSYPSHQVADFKQQIAELLYTPLPREYQEALNDEPLFPEPLTEAELDLLYKPLRVRVVFSIRSDQLSVVNTLSDYLPNVLKTFYELKPLSEKQARDAILRPAAQAGDFVTPRFEYQEAALAKIIGSLASQKADEIDTAQLQILLQYVEKDIVEGRKDSDITADDLGELNKVYENYYLNSLRKLTVGQKAAQVLIEDKLIADGRRVSYDKALCLQEVSESTLDALIETRLLRQEPNTLGGFSCEVSHDSLVAPILKTRDERKLRKQRRRMLRALGGVLVILLVCVFAASYFRRAQLKAIASAQLLEEALLDAKKSDSASRRADSLTKIALDSARRAGSAARSALVAATRSDSITKVALRDAKLSQEKAEEEKSRAQAEQSKTKAALARARSEEKQRLEAEMAQLDADARVYQKSGDSTLVAENYLRRAQLRRQIHLLQQELK